MIARRILMVAMLVASSWSAASAQDRDSKKGSIYKDDALGFSMNPPGFKAGPGPRVGSVAIFSGPAEAGFAANLNILIQRVGFDDFIKASDGSFQAAGLEVLSKTMGKAGKHRTCEYLYQGTLQGKALKFLALAVEDGDRVFLLTGTSLQQNFDANEPAFREAISSFALAK